MKLRKTFYQQMKLHYSSRKYKEIISIGCSDKCLQNYREDDLTRNETSCMLNCFNKYYGFLALTNQVYSVIAKSEDGGRMMDKEDGSDG